MRFQLRFSDVADHVDIHGAVPADDAAVVRSFGDVYKRQAQSFAKDRKSSRFSRFEKPPRRSNHMGLEK